MKPGGGGKSVIQHSSTRPTSSGRKVEALVVVIAKWTIRVSLHFLHFVGFDERERPCDGLVVAGAERIDGEGPVDGLPGAGRESRLRRTGLLRRRSTGCRGTAIREAVEAAEDLQAEPVVEEVAFADQLAVAVDLLDIALHRAGEEGVGEPLPAMLSAASQAAAKTGLRRRAA